jgi:hypothetical protein
MSKGFTNKRKYINSLKYHSFCIKVKPLLVNTLKPDGAIFDENVPLSCAQLDNVFLTFVHFSWIVFYSLRVNVLYLRSVRCTYFRSLSSFHSKSCVNSLKWTPPYSERCWKVSRVFTIERFYCICFFDAV